MSARIAQNARRMSNPRAERACSASGKGLQPIFDLSATIKAIFPVKTANRYAVAARISERMARYQLSRRYRISAPALTALLRSEYGLRVLEEIMGDAKPKWWRGFRRQKSIAALRAQQTANERLLRALEESAAD